MPYGVVELGEGLGEVGRAVAGPLGGLGGGAGGLTPCLMPPPGVVGAPRVSPAAGVVAVLGALGRESGVTVGGSAIAVALALPFPVPVPVEPVVGEGEAPALGSATTGPFATGTGGTGARCDMPRYTPPTAATITRGTARSAAAPSFALFGLGSAIGGGRIESGIWMPAAFVIEARTPLVCAPCASSVACIHLCSLAGTFAPSP